jgi:hypothetical protein
VYFLGELREPLALFVPWRLINKNAPSGIGERIWLQSKDRDDPVLLSFPVQPKHAHKPDNRSFGCGQALGLGFIDEILHRIFHVGGYFTIWWTCVNVTFIPKIPITLFGTIHVYKSSLRKPYALKKRGLFCHQGFLYNECTLETGRFHEKSLCAVDHIFIIRFSCSLY